MSTLTVSWNHMQDFITLGQPLRGENWPQEKEERERETKLLIVATMFWQRAGHAHRSDQFILGFLPALSIPLTLSLCIQSVTQWLAAHLIEWLHWMTICWVGGNIECTQSDRMRRHLRNMSANFCGCSNFRLKQFLSCIYMYGRIMFKTSFWFFDLQIYRALKKIAHRYRATVYKTNIYIIFFLANVYFDVSLIL
jgi:hypothetical protein